MNFPHPEDPRQIAERPPGYLRVSGKNGVHMLRKEAPMLPAMPDMLPEDPTEIAYSAGALKAMMTAHTADNEQVRAMGGAIRAVIVGAGLVIVATFAWGAAYLMWPWVDLPWLCAAWAGAVLITVLYVFISEGSGRKYSAAGVEHAKIKAAVTMHADRLDARREMHAAATEAWENVLTAYLEREWRE